MPALPIAYLTNFHLSDRTVRWSCKEVTDGRSGSSNLMLRQMLAVHGLPVGTCRPDQSDVHILHKLFRRKLDRLVRPAPLLQVLRAPRSDVAVVRLCVCVAGPVVGAAAAVRRAEHPHGAGLVVDGRGEEGVADLLRDVMHHHPALQRRDPEERPAVRATPSTAAGRSWATPQRTPS